MSYIVILKILILKKYFSISRDLSLGRVSKEEQASTKKNPLKKSPQS